MRLNGNGQLGRWEFARRAAPSAKRGADDPADWQGVEQPSWRERAQDARRIAEQLADAVAKQTMLDIARAYDTLVELTKVQPTSESLRVIRAGYEL